MANRPRRLRASAQITTFEHYGRMSERQAADNQTDKPEHYLIATLYTPRHTEPYIMSTGE
jgi:hypothetical protein